MILLILLYSSSVLLILLLHSLLYYCLWYEYYLYKCSMKNIYNSILLSVLYYTTRLLYISTLWRTHNSEKMNKSTGCTESYTAPPRLSSTEA